MANSYTIFDTNKDTVNSIDRVFASAWSNNTNDLGTSHFSSSTQYDKSTPTSSGQFFMEIYDKHPVNDTTAEVQYSIAYGHRNGLGSELFNTGTGAETFSAAKAIYSQYRNLVFGGDETQNFNFAGYTPDDIYVININRARYKNAIRLGNIKINLSAGSGSLASGAKRTITLTDDSVTTSGSANAIRPGVGREFNIVSGSNGVRLGTTTSQTTSGSYGYVYPDAGFIILNADALDVSSSLANFAAGAGGINLATSHSVGTGVAHADNPRRLQDAIKQGGSFILDSQEDIASKFYFCRVFNRDFNYSTNDSFTGTDGTLTYDSMIDNPQVYITTIGLYNNNQDLLAVAKLSQPLPKNFTKEALIKVKLDY